MQSTILSRAVPSNQCFRHVPVQFLLRCKVIPIKSHLKFTGGLKSQLPLTA